MRRAFVKEDVEAVERVTRRRSCSGLPPGALNYMTTDGATCLRARLEELHADPERARAEIEELENILQSATIVEPQVRWDVVTFGVRVTLEDPEGNRLGYRIAGVDEESLNPANVSWISPLGKAMLGAERGQRIKVPGHETPMRIVEIDRAG